MKTEIVRTVQKSLEKASSAGGSSNAVPCALTATTYSCYEEAMLAKQLLASLRTVTENDLNAILRRDGHWYVYASVQVNNKLSINIKARPPAIRNASNVEIPPFYFTARRLKFRIPYTSIGFWDEFCDIDYLFSVPMYNRCVNAMRITERDIEACISRAKLKPWM